MSCKFLQMLCGEVRAGEERGVSCVQCSLGVGASVDLSRGGPLGGAGRGKAETKDKRVPAWRGAGE